jgi:hypothetical protein
VRLCWNFANRSRRSNEPFAVFRSSRRHSRLWSKHDCECCAGFAICGNARDDEQRRKCTAIIAHAGVVTAIRRTAASTVVTCTATAHPASLFAWESATGAIIATGTTAAAPIGAEHLKSGTAPALRSRQSSATDRNQSAALHGEIRSIRPTHAHDAMGFIRSLVAPKVKRGSSFSSCQVTRPLGREAEHLPAYQPRSCVERILF